MNSIKTLYYAGKDLNKDLRMCEIFDELEKTEGVEINCGRNKSNYSVYGRKNDFMKPLHECQDSRNLVKWFNTTWEKIKEEK